jgi:hypothetical protein
VPPFEAMARLRFADRSAGESAARWIHLYAITLTLVVVLPRLPLAGWSAWRRSRALASRTLPRDEPYFRALLRDGPATERPVTVLPYSYTQSAPRVKALLPALRDAIGPGAQPQVKPTLPLGAEDALPAAALEDAQGDVAALFAANATPERETQGAFVQALQRALGTRATVSVVAEAASRDALRRLYPHAVDALGARNMEGAGGAATSSARTVVPHPACANARSTISRVPGDRSPLAATRAIASRAALRYGSARWLQRSIARASALASWLLKLSISRTMSVHSA